MTPGESDVEEFDEFEIKTETDKAILVLIHDSALDDEIWIPKSLCVVEPDRLQVKTWFCRKEGLI